MAKQIYNKTFDPDKWEKVNQENKDIIDDFITECKAQKKSEGTRKQYYNDCRIIAIYCLEQLNNKSFLDLTKRNFRDFVIYAQEEWKVSNSRINRLLSCIHMILDFCENDDELYEDYNRNASEKIKGLPREEVRKIIFIPDDVIMKLWQKFMDEKRYKEATLLGLLYDSGCRKNEILQVRRDSISQDGNSTNEVRGKRGKIFRCLYFRLTKEAFKKYEEVRTDESNILFPTATGNAPTPTTLYEWVTNWKKDLKELTGDEYDLNVHSFRHCFVENMCSGTHYLCREMNLGKISIEKVKTLVHHSDISTTDKYRFNDENRDIEELFGIKLE